MKTIHQVLDIAASPDSVWKALTQEDGLAACSSTEARSDGAAPGSLIRFTFKGDFNPVVEITKINETEAPAWRCVEGHDNWKDNELTFELAHLDDGALQAQVLSALRGRTQ